MVQCDCKILCYSHTRGSMSHSSRFYLAREMLPRMHYGITGVGQNAAVLQLPSEVSMRTCDTVAKCPIPILPLCHCITLKHVRVIPLYTLCITLSVTISKTTSAHAHSDTVGGGNFKHLKTSVGDSRIGTVGKFAYRCQVIVTGQGCFTQCVLLQGVHL